MKLSDLRRKEVVNINDGKSLGYICDAEIDLCDGRIISIMLPGRFCLSSIFSDDNNICIKWCSICKIGEDVILVKLDPCMCQKG